jgi:hypothetical protein
MGCRNNIDRMTGQTLNERKHISSQVVTLKSPVTGTSRTFTMFYPLMEDGAIHSALILLHRLRKETFHVTNETPQEGSTSNWFGWAADSIRPT